MRSDIRSFIVELSQAKTKEQVLAVQMALLEYLHDLGINHADQLRQFSEAAVRNKEEWWKKSMTECIHLAGREVGYSHESTKVEIEAAKILLQIISDTELAVLSGFAHHSDDPEQTDPSSIPESSASPEPG